MNSLKLTNDFDVEIIDGMATFAHKADDIMQSIMVELEQNKGQWVLNEYFGVPWLNTENEGILQLKDNPNRIIVEMAKVIKKYEIEKIKEINFTEREQIKIVIQIKGEERELII